MPSRSVALPRRPVRQPANTDLSQDRLVGDAVVGGEERGLRQHDREEVVAVKREEDPARRVRSALNDADELVARHDHHVRGPEIDGVFVKGSTHSEGAVIEGAAGRDLEGREEPRDRCATNFANWGESAVCRGIPSLALVVGMRPTLAPHRIVADRGDAHEQVDIAHPFRQHDRRDVHKIDRSPRFARQPLETDVSGRRAVVQIRCPIDEHKIKANAILTLGEH